MRMVKLDGNGVVSVIEAPDPTPGPDEVVDRDRGLCPVRQRAARLSRPGRLSRQRRP